MAETETTTESWGSRLGGSIRGVLIGGALFIAGFPVLFWNEGNSVKTAKAIDEGEGACISLESNEKVDPEMNGKLVHMSGKADTKDVLTDDTFGISVTAIRLERHVEMYQWVEKTHSRKKKKLGGSEETETTYTYDPEWVDHVIDSSKFNPNKSQGRVNPGAMEFESNKLLASNVSFGAFRLAPDQIARIGSSKDYGFATNFVCKLARVKISEKMIYVPNAETRGNTNNVRDVLTQPRIGDMRVTFRVIEPHEISLIAKQHGDTFVAYTAKNGKRLSYLAEGIKDAAAMFESARTGNAIFTWLFRLGGFLMMYFGLSMVFRPLSVLADVLPILGDIVGMGMGLVAGLISLICALVTIAIAWIFFRPILGIILLVVAGGLLFLLVRKHLAAKKAAAVAVN